MDTFSSSRNNGKAQLAVSIFFLSMLSTNIMWNWRGSKKAAANESSISVAQGPSLTGRNRADSASGCWAKNWLSSEIPPNMPNNAKRPTIIRVINLTKDSNAMATTRPWCFSRREIWRAPNSIENSAIVIQNPSAIKPCCEPSVIICKVFVTAWICNDI